MNATSASAERNTPGDGSPRKHVWIRRLGRLLLWAVMTVVALLALAFGLFVVVVRRVPSGYPLAKKPIYPPVAQQLLGGGLPGFESPYLGHTGSWDGKGGGMAGSSKIPDLEIERRMGLHWTFMAVYWRAMEPEGPVDLTRQTPAAWRRLDSFVEAAHDRGLNVLMQAPVVGGNAGGPPKWAGRREPGKSAPANMEALAAFAGKLAERYRPGGTLAQAEGWGTNYGVRAWELDNEPANYFTCWAGQAADYAEFVTRAAQEIKRSDPSAVIVGPAIAGGKEGPAWMEAALDADGMRGSPAFRAQHQRFSIGPVCDVISFHNYEGLDSAFSGSPRTIGQVFDDVQQVMENWENRTSGFSYARKQDYWHTEGNFDFVGLLSAERRSAWRFQFFTRAFASGIRKLVVMDASPAEQTAVGAYIRILPNPFPMFGTSNEVHVLRGQVQAFRHPDGDAHGGGQVWVVWPMAGAGGASVEIPVHNKTIQLMPVSGHLTLQEASEGKVRIDLPGDLKMAAGILVVDRAPAWEKTE